MSTSESSTFFNSLCWWITKPNCLKREKTNFLPPKSSSTCVTSPLKNSPGYKVFIQANHTGIGAESRAKRMRSRVTWRCYGIHDHVILFCQLFRVEICRLGFVVGWTGRRALRWEFLVRVVWELLDEMVLCSRLMVRSYSIFGNFQLSVNFRHMTSSNISYEHEILKSMLYNIAFTKSFSNSTVKIRWIF